MASTIRKLLDQGTKVRIYNVGRRATTTSAILDRVVEQLDHFNPNIVISLMGINDKKIAFSNKPGWWNNFWITKFYNWWTASLSTPIELLNRTFVPSETIDAFAASPLRKRGVEESSHEVIRCRLNRGI